jgi:hypothetical protein
MANPDPDDVEGQDLAEVFDETNITRDGDDIATSDQQRDVFDVVTAQDDADPDEALAAADDFDPDTLDEAEYEQIVLADEDLDQPRTFAGDDSERVRDGDLSPADLESDALDDDELADLGDAEPALGAALDERLDEALEETFPASDPLAVSPRAD